MAKKINHRGHGGHRELLFSLCSLWFFQNPFQKITKNHPLRTEMFIINPQQSETCASVA